MQNYIPIYPYISLYNPYNSYISLYNPTLFIVPKNIPLMTIGSHGHAKSHGPRAQGAPELLRQLIGRQLQTSQKRQGFHQRNADLAVLLAGTVTPLTLRCHGLTVTGTVNADWSSLNMTKKHENTGIYNHMKKCFCHWQHQVPNGFENLGCPVQGGAPGSWVGCYHSKALWWIYPDAMVVINQTYNCGAPTL